jgi:beta-glucosidase
LRCCKAAGIDKHKEEKEHTMDQQKLKSLVKDMSLTEKINQLLQVTSGFFIDEAVLTGPIRENGITEEGIAQAGSVIGLFGAKKYKEIQDA